MTNKSKTVAGLLALFLGGLGAHKFYLGKTGQGILYLIFVWTFIPAIVGAIEGIMYLVSSDEDFQTKYCGGVKPATTTYQNVSSQDLNMQQSNAPAFCPFCGALIDAGTSFCTQCGKSLK